MKPQPQRIPPRQYSPITLATLELRGEAPDLAASVMAAKLARAQCCTETAQRLYDQALQLISQQPEPRRLSWLQRLGARP